MAESIITVKRRTGFTVLSNSTLRDKRLSLKTRAILAIMISMPEDWDYTVSGLASVCGAGKSAVSSALQEMEDFGYLTRIQRHDNAGHFSRTEYIVTDEPTGDRAAESCDNDTPLSENPSTVHPSTVDPSTDQPLTGNQTQQNKDCTNTPYSPPEGDVQEPVQECAKQAVDWGLFERFWSAYPRKQNKERARRAWKKLNPDVELCRIMSAALERDKQSDQWRRDGGEYIPHPSSWLNGRRWEDEHGTVVPAYEPPPGNVRAPDPEVY